MEFHRGRLIDHVHFVVSDLERSRGFYRAALEALGRELSGGNEGYAARRSADSILITPET